MGHLSNVTTDATCCPDINIEDVVLNMIEIADTAFSRSGFNWALGFGMRRLGYRVGGSSTGPAQAFKPSRQHREHGRNIIG